MSFWTSNGISNANLERLGPMIDGFVGTDGRYSDLYAAYTSGGWRKIILAAGATLSADLTISATGVFIWSPYHPGALSLGSKRLIITGQDVALAGFKLTGGTGVGITISGTGVAYIERVRVDNFSSHGIDITSSTNDPSIKSCIVRDNTGDGIQIASGCDGARVSDSLIFNNGGYGIDDNDDSSILIGNKITSNTAGQINGTPSVNQNKTS